MGFKKIITKKSKILVSGGHGMVGSAIIRKLKKLKYTKILNPSKKELNLLNQLQVDKYLKKNKPDFIFVCAGKVGGIKAKTTLCLSSSVKFGKGGKRAL